MRSSKPARRIGLALTLSGCVLAGAVCAQSASPRDPLGKINAALQAGQADVALSAIRALPQGGTQSAEAQNLACRVHFTLRQWDAAVVECQRATRLDTKNARYHLWLGRALGEKAGHASFLSAYSLGKAARSEFEQAARLNPRDAEALTDLGEFYREAPGIVGGGTDKTEQIVSQLDAFDQARAHQLRARIAEGRSDFGTAEREFKAAVSSSPHPALHWTNLASFFRRRQRWQDLDWAIHNSYTAASRDRGATIAFYDGAGVLTESKRDPAFAAKLLETYLAADTRTEEGPSFEAHLRLAHLKFQLGDRAAAERERSAALGLAHDYKPALDAKF
ncbi:MAG: tetratricopeptide repeat protein [Terracidiphilus sp.]|nr:tetratricopeptide repeat protein [Terracidiphilus sp.]